MGRWLRILLSLCWLGLLSGPPTGAAMPRPARVILISLDGARPDALQQADMPHLAGLAASGAVDWAAQTVFPPVTLPAHTSMLTGLAVADHGVDWNGTNPGCLPVEPPTFLTLAERAGYRTAFVSGKEKFCHLVQTPEMDYTFALAGDRSIADRALELLQDGYQVIFLHFPNPDYFGHLHGWMSDTYLSELTSSDAQIGRVLAKLEALGVADQTLIIVTADHGGHDFEHGARRPEDMTIPWMIAGPGVLSGTALAGVQVTDTAATVLWVLGLPSPPGLTGRPVCAAFGLVPDDAAGCRAAAGGAAQAEGAL